MDEKFANLVESLKEDSNVFNEMVDRVVKEYSDDLDYLMIDLKDALTQQEAASTDTIERYYAELSNLVYFMSDKVEKLNIFADISKAQAKEAYNVAYLNVCSDKDEKGKSIRTVNENTAIAENQSKYEFTLNTVYDHAYKTLRSKVDMAMEMITTLKNILKRRSQEEYLSYSMNNLKLKEEDADE